MSECVSEHMSEHMSRHISCYVMLHDGTNLFLRLAATIVVPPDMILGLRSQRGFAVMVSRLSLAITAVVVCHRRCRCCCCHCCHWTAYLATSTMHVDTHVPTNLQSQIYTHLCSKFFAPPCPIHRRRASAPDKKMLAVSAQTLLRVVM